MNSLRRTKKKCLVPLALTWSHLGVSYRVTPWPEVRFECLYGEDWIATSPTEEVLASAAQECGAAAWRPYLEFVEPAVRSFLELFTTTRMEALQVAARCPSLLPLLSEVTALTAFLASHVNLRGTSEPCWAEIEAIYERSGVYGLLEWLGMPASKQTVTILQAIAERDLAKRFLAPLRSMLWEPTTIWALQRMPSISDRELARACNALAA